MHVDFVHTLPPHVSAQLTVVTQWRLSGMRVFDPGRVKPSSDAQGASTLQSPYLTGSKIATHST